MRIVARVVISALLGVSLFVITPRARDGWSIARETYAKLRSEPPKLWMLSDFAVRDHKRQLISRTTLQGQPFIADFIFTQCTDACPLLTARMVHLQRQLAQRNIHFVSVSVDPEHDDSEALAAYAQRFHAQETRWSLLTTDKNSLAIITQTFKVSDAAATPNTALLHSDMFFLVDKDSYIRGIYASSDPKALEQLLKDASSLSESLAVANADVTNTRISEPNSMAEPLKRSAREDAATPATAVDPVCHMSVHPDHATPHTTYAGHTVYFCSDTCRNSFLTDPSKYPLNSLSAR